MIYESINLDKVEMPIISIIDDACKYCDNTKYECLIKNKHINCNKQNTCSACGECISKYNPYYYFSYAHSNDTPLLL